ncbi:15023_t:CDS:2, partial [Racocetra persica]
GNRPDYQRAKEWEKNNKPKISISKFKNGDRVLRKKQNINYAEFTKAKSVQSENNHETFDQTHFEIIYNSLDPNKIWTLKSSGRVVEEVIYDYARNLTHESYLHSFIINDIDAETKSLFFEEEWQEIFNVEVNDKPKLKSSIKDLLKNCSVDDPKKLRKILYESFLSDDFDLEFINYAYQGMMFLWNKDENPFDHSKLEGWYEVNVWGRLIDPAFDNLLNIDLVRGEGMSLASSDRKNFKRSLDTRKKVGRKGDGVFRLHKDRLEFGIIEAGRKWEGQAGSKYLSDSLKASKMLKDMLCQLVSECDMKESLSRKLQAVGILHGANRIQIITADLPEGYITRIRRRKIQEVTGRLTVSNPLALVLKEILYAKTIISQTVDVISKKYLDIEKVLDSDDEYDMLPVIELVETFATPRPSETCV